MVHEEQLKISIAMATYNGSKYIQEQLDSFACQTRLPDEVIICDDGSTDETFTICEHFKERSPFTVQVFQNDHNIGYARNFERALSLCSGDVVFLSDQDDVWYPEKIAAIVNRFVADKNTMLIIHDIEYCDVFLNRTGQSKIQRIAATQDPLTGYVTGMATAVRRAFLASCLPFPQYLESFTTHDRWLHECALLIDAKSIVPTVFADYRRHATNATSAQLLNNISFSTPSAYQRAFRKRKTIRHFHVESEVLTRKLRLKQELLIWLQEYDKHSRIPLTAIARLERSVEKVHARVSALSIPRFKRLPVLLRNYVSGTYDEFKGIASLLKDLLIN